MLLLRVVLTIAGTILGIIAMWQTLATVAINFHPGFIFLFYIAAGTTLGGIFLLSAPLVRLMFHKMAGYWRARFKDFKTVDVAGIAAGIVVGLTVAFLINFIFEVFLPILALRLFIAVVLGLIMAFITVVATSSWLSKVQEGEPILTDDTNLTVKLLKGFLLTPNALEHPKILLLSENWLEGSVFVLAKLAQQLEQLDAGERFESNAYKNYKELRQKRLIKVLDYFSPKAFDEELEAEYYIDAAIAKKVKIVTDSNGIKALTNPKSAVILNLDELL